ncbi:hypothetical protein D6850_05995 [Roseovarius spongiae]|uniref:Uncharacterized protein n=1 Tax=Roseovarius spongiae TaxID=2320272 RepID=A0A3A8AYR3_9RHOB|nr:hypothetical protein [Roseovarius spongiae]RKF17066.1 hypothetical protein D6850_05995 [Roseovarius spongiae]
MNANQIINMAMRMIMRRLMRGGINAGMDAVGKRMSKGKTGAPAEGAPPQGKEAQKRMRQTMRSMRRMGRM